MEDCGGRFDDGVRPRKLSSAAVVSLGSGVKDGPTTTKASWQLEGTLGRSQDASISHRLDTCVPDSSAEYNNSKDVRKAG